jgi:ribonuclease E
MANKMLIDAAHPEETRVVVLRGNRVEEFDFESASRKQLRGNIYLAKVTRVEPSLQAAFVDYGGNRHGFLAFSEIHPDYYQIPVADRQALIEAEEFELAEADTRAAELDDLASESGEQPAANDAPDETASGPHHQAAGRQIPADDRSASEQPVGEQTGPEVLRESTLLAHAVMSAEPVGAADEGTSEASDEVFDASDGEDEPTDNSEEVVSDDSVESVGAEDALEEVPERKKPHIRQYKIQEVIKRRQVLLVQVVKEERGNKGAALTTYLSLAGRYSVLMPNTARGGGISRKITSPADRKRLKQVAMDLDVPEGMGVILRTAGASRTKSEVKRDFEYLLRLWENVRELTLKSSAPTLVYEEGSLIKRSIRDLYNKDIDEVVVAGDDAYREAKDFMRMLMPSHAKNVKPYRDKQPLFARSGIEAQLDAMFSPQVTLRSGGYIVINQTEALVSIDVNSGRSTREHNIEDTAHQTNLEAADEIARQLRLRDLAGLVVVDFIDMEEKRNNRSVERKLKEALKNDRARIQVGRISHFGLLEMSRQRIRTGVLESTTTVCPACQGTGHIRAPSSVALHVLRSLEDQLLRGVTHHLIVRTRTPVALYILNQKRAHLSELEQRFGLDVTVSADESIANGSHFQIERGEPVEVRQALPTSVQPDSVVFEDEEEIADLEAFAAEREDREDLRERGEADEAGGRRRRRRRRRKGGESAAGTDSSGAIAAAGERPDDGELPTEADRAQPAEVNGGEEGRQRKRRRGRRGGRRGRRGRDEERVGTPENDRSDGMSSAAFVARGGDDVFADPYEIDTTPVMAPRPQRESDEVTNSDEAELPAPAPLAEEDQIGPVSFGPRDPADTTAEHEPVEDAFRDRAPTRASEDEDHSDDGRPKRSGWWQRRSFF